MATKPKQFELIDVKMTVVDGEQVWDGEIVVRYKFNPHKSKSAKSYVVGTSSGRDTFSWGGKAFHVNFNAYVMTAEWERGPLSSLKKKPAA